MSPFSLLLCKSPELSADICSERAGTKALGTGDETVSCGAADFDSGIASEGLTETCRYRQEREEHK